MQARGRTTYLLFAAAAAAVLALVALAAVLNYGTLKRDAVQQAEHTATALTEHALRTFRAHELLLHFVGAYVAGRSWEEIRASAELHRLLRGVADKSPDIRNIFLVDGEGRLAATTAAFPAPPVDAADRDYYAALRANDVVYVSGRVTGRVSGEPAFSMARRRPSPGGGFDGLIAVSVNPAYYESFYQSFLGPGEVTNLVRADGAILARYPATANEPPALPPGAPLRQAIERGAQGTYTAASGLDGVMRVVAYRRVGDFPVFASFQRPTAAIWEAWRRMMAPYLGASLLALIGLAAVIRVVEHRRRRELAEERERQAASSARAKDLLIAGVSHELRNPLSAIAVAVELLQSGTESRVALATEVLSRQVGHMATILDDLLDTARAAYGKLKLDRRRLDLHALAGRVVADRALQAGAAIRLSGETAWVDGDPVRLRQMIDNLVENALRYGGRHIDVQVRAAGDKSELVVRDDGQGIAPELLPRLYEPFAQGERALDRRQGGLGLGLALVSRLAHLHGGEVTAHSDGPGRGSTFTLRLPRAQPGERRVEAPLPARTHAVQRILLVQEGSDERELLRALLEGAGHDVIATASGQEALRAAERASPHIAFVDVRLAGIDFARRLAALRPATRLIALTGCGDAAEEAAVRNAGWERLLRKPLAPGDLLDTVAQGATASAMSPGAQPYRERRVR